MTIEYVKLEIFIPETHFPQLQRALQSVDAGHIGNYDSCLSYAPVMGRLPGRIPILESKMRYRARRS